MLILLSWQNRLTTGQRVGGLSAGSDCPYCSICMVNNLTFWVYQLSLFLLPTILEFSLSSLRKCFFYIIELYKNTIDCNCSLLTIQHICMLIGKQKRFLYHYRGCCLTMFCFLAGLPPVLCPILWILRQGEKNRECRIQVAPCVLPCWDGCLCLQFHHSIEKVIISLKNR